MADTVLLDNIAHHDLRIRLGHGAAFGEAVNQVAILFTELDEVQRDFPIVFRKDDQDRFQAYALLGLDRDENLFLDGDRWQAGHVPLALQRGPFRIGIPEDAEDGAVVVLIDPDHPRLGREEGEPLFLPHGGNAPYLDHMLRVLAAIDRGLKANAPMFEAFASADLIRPVTLQIVVDDTVRYDVSDCFTIDTERLAQLDGEMLERLNRQGFLRAAFLVASSLGNVSRLIERKSRKRATAADAAVPA